MSENQMPRPRMLDHFALCQDSRKHRIRHELIDVIAIVVLGTVCGEEGWEGFVDWAHDKKDFLSQFLTLKSGIPCADTLRRVVERLDPESFFNAFSSWIQEINQRLPGQICIDGKVLESAQNEGGPLRLVSAWCEHSQMVLGCTNASAKKGSEITAIKDLLNALILCKGDIITIDAIGCQKEIVQKVVDQKADYVIALKQNQPSLFDEVENFFFQALQAPEYAPCQIHTYTDEAFKDRHDVWVTQELDWLHLQKDWKGLKSLIMVKRVWQEGDRPNVEMRYYISSLTQDPETLGHLIRRHWAIENEYHWHLDVTFREDESRISGQANRNLRVARDMALKLLRSESSHARGLKAKMRRCHRSDAYLQQVLISGKF